MNNTDARALGALGEEEAARAYTSQGYVVLERNWRCRLGEVDLVLRKGNMLVFAEVKARRTGTGFDPASAVTPAKTSRLRRLAQAYIASHRELGSLDIRFDVVCVEAAGNRVLLEILEAAF